MGVRVFICCSGIHSVRAAKHLAKFLQDILPPLEFWFYEQNEGGKIWPKSVLDELQSADIGIVCLDVSNKDNSWMHFEAGALWGKHPENYTVIPYFLFGIGPSDIGPGPLIFFTGYKADEHGTLELLVRLNKILIERGELNHTPAGLVERFRGSWKDFEKNLTAAQSLPLPDPDFRTNSDMLSELVDLARNQARFISAIAKENRGEFLPIRTIKNSWISESADEVLLLHETALQLRNLGNFRMALRLLEMALERDTESIIVPIDIAVTKTYLDEYSKKDSIKDLRKIIKNFSEDTPKEFKAKAFYNLACIMQIARGKEARYTDAQIIENVTQALKEFPDYVRIAQVDHDLESLRNNKAFKELIEKFKKIVK